MAFSSNRKEILEKLKLRLPEILPLKWSETKPQSAKCHFLFFRKPETGKFTLKKDDELLSESLGFRAALEQLSSGIRLTVAEFAVEKVFLHSGVVGCKDAAIIIPGKSFAGKSTLVAEFVRRGFSYFSDEYALLDKKGFVHPFPKKISLRGIIDDYRQKDFNVEQLGGRPTLKPLPVKFILIGEYKKGSSAQISEASASEGFLQSIANSISIRQSPRIVLEALAKIAEQSKTLKIQRGEAAEFVEIFIEYLENLEPNEVTCVD